MSNLHVKYLLVGGGLASSSAAKAIRRLDPEAACMLVGSEINRPYHRPPLTKEYLRREKPRSELFATEPEWFAANHVELRTGRRVSHVDAARRTVTLDDGKEIAFDKLLIATGGSPARLKVPGAELPNIFYIRAIEDADRLNKAVDKAKAEGQPNGNGSDRGRAVVIGGGVLGVEVAASLRKLGMAIDLVVSKPYPWDKVAGETTGKFLVRYLEKHAVSVHTDRNVVRLEGDGRVQRVVVDGKGQEESTLRCDFVVAAVGMVVNKDLLRGTPIAAERAILVDEHCRTSAADIYAAGDCAAIFDPLFGKYRVLDHWDNAIVSGTLAGENMTGADKRYDAVNYFFSDVFELSMSAWGEPRQVDRRLIRGNTNENSPDFMDIGVASDGRIAQVVAINHPGEDDTLRELVKRRLQVDGNEESLKDPTTSLQSLLG